MAATHCDGGTLYRLRRDNVVSLQWSQVDLARGLIVLDHTKNGDRLGIPLCENRHEDGSREAELAICQ